MRKTKFWRKMTAAFFVASALAAGCLAGSLPITAWAYPTAATCVADNIVVRESAVDGAQVGGLSEGQEVTIVDETTGSDGRTWYEITYDLDGSERTGWVRGDLISATEESEEDVPDDAEETITGDDDEEAMVSLVFATQSGSVTLTAIPDEELALVSDRFTETTLDFAEGTVNALQLLEPDELVADDAAIVDYYYVYGQNEIGETGWYIYNVEEGSLQKNLLNMEYSIPETEEEEEDTALVLDSTVRMIGSALSVICLLLLVLVIIISIRYRRLRFFYEEETNGDWVIIRDPQKSEKEEPASERQRDGAEPEPKKRRRHAEPVIEEVPVQESETASEIRGVNVLDLDQMEDEDYEALLNQYLDETEGSVASEEAAPEDAASEEAVPEDVVSEDPVPTDEVPADAGAGITGETGNAGADEEEPEFYDDEDDDLEFL